MIIDTAKDLSGERRTKRPANCVACAVPMVSGSVVGPAREGFQKYAAKGLCRKCYSSDGSRERVPIPDGCRRCARPLRAVKSDPVPGSVVHNARGLCVACYRASEAEGTLRSYGPLLQRATPRQPPPTPESAARKVRWDTIALLGFLAARRRRVGADGTLDEFPALSGRVA